MILIFNTSIYLFSNINLFSIVNPGIKAFQNKNKSKREKVSEKSLQG